MSMNLYIEHNGVKQELYQTPTYITYMCLMSDIGLLGTVRGKKASRAIRCYIEYVKSRMSGKWDDEAEFRDALAANQAHVKAIEALIGKKGVVVYYL